MKKLHKNKYLFLQNILKYSFVFVFLFAVVFPFFVNADHIAGHPKSAGGGQNSSAGGGENSSVNINVKINNPLGKISSIPQFMEALLNIVITIGVPLVAIAIIYTGFLFVKAQGNAEELKTAKKALMYTLIGAGLILGAWVLANAIKGTVEQIRSENG